MASAFVAYSTVMTDREGYRRVLTVSPGDARMVADDHVEALTLERPARWTGPMAILVNDNTGSCAEAVAIQASRAGRALIVGEPSIGVGNNTVQPAPLPEGWRLLMTVAWSTTPAGEALPPRPPLDVEVADDPLAIAATGRDAVLEAAVEHLGR
jgi:carboxyl-terminal processing protease